MMFSFKKKKDDLYTILTKGRTLFVDKETYEYIDDLKDKNIVLRIENDKLKREIEELKPIAEDKKHKKEITKERKKCKYSIIGSSECKKCKHSIIVSSHMFVGQIDPFLGCNRDIVCEHFDTLEEE